MGKRVFLVGAAGVLGRRFSPLLVEAGHRVYGTTRKHDAAEWLSSIGVAPVVVDVFDAAALTKALVEERPEIVLHQLTCDFNKRDPSEFVTGSLGNFTFQRYWLGDTQWIAGFEAEALHLDLEISTVYSFGFRCQPSQSRSGG